MFAIQPFESQHLLPAMRLAAKTLPEQYPTEFFLQLARDVNRYFRVAVEVESGRVIGLIVGARQPGMEGNVLLFAVDSDFQGQGIGRALLKDLQRRMSIEDIRSIKLEVRPDNRRAISFYEHEGFSVTGLEEHAYKDGSDALWMAKTLR